MNLQIVSFSSGLSSAVTVERVLTGFHPSQIVVIFMDTLVEHEDNYRFLFDCYNRWRRLYGHEWRFFRLCEGRTPEQVWYDRQIIPNQKIAPCTFELKIEPFTQAILDLACGWPIGYSRHVFGSITTQRFKRAAFEALRVNQIIVHIGYDLIEDAHRMDATRTGYANYGFQVDFPLTWKPYELRKYADVVRNDWHIEPPIMYNKGYSHANCGGTCCKQGVGDWLITEENNPSAFYRKADWEWGMQLKHDINYTFCRDQRNGQVKPVSLYEVARRKELLNRQQASLFQCVDCGIGGLE